MGLTSVCVTFSLCCFVNLSHRKKNPARISLLTKNVNVQHLCLDVFWEELSCSVSPWWLAVLKHQLFLSWCCRSHVCSCQRNYPGPAQSMDLNNRRECDIICVRQRVADRDSTFSLLLLCTTECLGILWRLCDQKRIWPGLSLKWFILPYFSQRNFSW